MVGPWAMYEMVDSLQDVSVEPNANADYANEGADSPRATGKNCACVILWLGRGLKMPSSMLIMVNKG